MSENDRYYTKEVYVCRECGKQWDVPGAASICHKKDRIFRLVDEIDSHKTFALDEAIEQLEEYVQDDE